MSTSKKCPPFALRYARELGARDAKLIEQRKRHAARVGELEQRIDDLRKQIDGVRREREKELDEMRRKFSDAHQNYSDTAQQLASVRVVAERDRIRAIELEKEIDRLRKFFPVTRKVGPPTQTAEQVVAALNSDASFNVNSIADVYNGKVRVRSKSLLSEKGIVVIARMQCLYCACVFERGFTKRDAFLPFTPTETMPVVARCSVEVEVERVRRTWYGKRYIVKDVERTRVFCPRCSAAVRLIERRTA